MLIVRLLKALLLATFINKISGNMPPVVVNRPENDGPIIAKQFFHIFGIFG